LFTPVSNIDAGTENFTSDMATGLVDTDPGNATSSTDLTTSLDSWGLILSTFDIIKKMFSVLVLPGPFLKSIGVNALFADAVQVIMNVGVAWGLIQFATNRSIKQYE
jgi:hypothetical protein